MSISASQITHGGGDEHKTNGIDDGVKSKSEQLITECEFDTPEIDKDAKMNLREKKLIDFRGKLYLAPLTTVGNLPFRRLCKLLGADITCGEMAMCANLLQGQASEWALLRRHSSEDLFGVQICGAYPDMIAHTVELIERECSVDFIDINMGCPIDIVVNKGAGSSLLNKPVKMQNIIKAAAATIEKPLTVKVRTGYFEGRNCVHSRISDFSKAGAAAITIHGRTRQQRYSKLADWDYIYQCAQAAPDDLQVVGNGDIFAYTDWNEHLQNGTNLSTCMIARGALIKPWIFTEIKEQRHWDISASERFDILKDFARFGLQHWGSDKKGVETTRHFLLEWLSYSYRYIPVSLLDIVPQRMNWRPPSYFGRNDLETLLASDSAADWVRISEMLLGPAPAGFMFTPKHKSNAYDSTDNG
uniref:tRNA-dihydrouridine(47) synthase [NAD(P)(+)] n=1 Tax=Araucaria cunninghamii TaxID=56994 RepID=A0A0D6QYK6_ARACU